MDASKLSAFERCALTSGLLTQAQLDEALSALGWMGKDPNAPRPEGRQLADKLVELGRLNPWQAQQLLDGRTRFTLGPYRIVDSIGQGGMGQVFKGVHTGTGQVGAIKILPRSRSTPEAINYFNREIQAHGKLDHPNLVRKLDSGHDGNVYYLVTEYVPGLDLRKFVRRNGPLDMHKAASVISQVAQGLQHAHEQNLIHRDVKPGNVLLTADGHSAKLSDLGLAGSFGPKEEDDPRHGKIVGTADYLSPDHIKDPSEPKPSWDIYSLGCTFYYAVTGKVPFPGGSVTEKARAHCDLQPLDPRRLNPSLSAEFVDVIADMMDKDPARRIQSAADVVARLSPWTGAAIPAATSEGARAKLLERRRAKRAAAVASDAGDTKTGFPQIPDLRPEPREAPSQGSQPTHSVAAADETLGTIITREDEKRPLQLWKPLVVLVITPLLLVGGLLALQWLLELLGR